MEIIYKLLRRSIISFCLFVQFGLFTYQCYFLLASINALEPMMLQQQGQDDLLQLTYTYNVAKNEQGAQTLKAFLAEQQIPYVMLAQSSLVDNESGKTYLTHIIDAADMETLQFTTKVQEPLQHTLYLDSHIGIKAKIGEQLSVTLEQNESNDAFDSPIVAGFIDHQKLQPMTDQVHSNTTTNLVPYIVIVDNPLKYQNQMMTMMLPKEKELLLLNFLSDMKMNVTYVNQGISSHDMESILGGSWAFFGLILLLMLIILWFYYRQIRLLDQKQIGLQYLVGATRMRIYCDFLTPMWLLAILSFIGVAVYAITGNISFYSFGAGMLDRGALVMTLFILLFAITLPATGLFKDLPKSGQTYIKGGK